MGKRIDLTSEKLQIEREERAERELAEAKRLKEEADAKLKAAKEAEEKAAARAERDAAKVKMDNATRRVQDLASDKSLANDQTDAKSRQQQDRMAGRKSLANDHLQGC